VNDKKYKAGLRFCCANCQQAIYQDRAVKGTICRSHTIHIENQHSMECSFPLVPSVSDISNGGFFGNDCREMLGGAFLPALVGAVFIKHFPEEYNQAVFVPEATTLVSMGNILMTNYGVSLTLNRLEQGLLKFLPLIHPTSSDSGNFRNDLKACTEVKVNASAEMIFLKLAFAKTAQRKEHAGAKKRPIPVDGLTSKCPKVAADEFGEDLGVKPIHWKTDKSGAGGADLSEVLVAPEFKNALGKPISHSDASLRTITIRKALPMRLGDALPLPDAMQGLIDGWWGLRGARYVPRGAQLRSARPCR
jgi:hypothetical protein